MSQRFTIEGPSGALEILTESPSDPKPITVVICHPHPLYQGTMDNKVVTMTAKAFMNLGYHTVRFNYRGVGKSEGKYGGGIGETEDCLAAINHIKQERPNNTIWLAGFSFGGFVAYNAATQIETQELLLIAPGVTRLDFSQLTEPKTPLTVIQGGDDEVIDPQAVYAWLNQVDASYRLVKLAGIGHFFHGNLPLLKNTIIEAYASRG